MDAKEKLITTAREIARIADERGLADSETVSIGFWSAPQPTALPGVSLPEFQAVIALEVGDFRELLK